MPKTNWEFCQGQSAPADAVNPFPLGSGSACSWDLGRRTPRQPRPTAEAGMARLAATGLQGYNARELALGMLDQL